MAVTPGPTTPSSRLAERALTPLLIAAAIFLVLLEATVWRWLTALGQAMARLSFFAALELLIERLSPTAVVALFVLPFIPIIPLLKLAELWLIGHHHFVWAAIVIVGAKVAGAAFSTRIFAIARPKMLQVRWFGRAYGGATRLLALGHETLERLPGWAAAQRCAHRLHVAARDAVVVAGESVREHIFARSQGRMGRRLAAAVRWVRG